MFHSRPVGIDNLPIQRDTFFLQLLYCFRCGLKTKKKKKKKKNFFCKIYQMMGFDEQKRKKKLLIFFQKVSNFFGIFFLCFSFCYEFFSSKIFESNKKWPKNELENFEEKKCVRGFLPEGPPARVDHTGAGWSCCSNHPKLW